MRSHIKPASYSPKSEHLALWEAGEQIIRSIKIGHHQIKCELSSDNCCFPAQSLPVGRHIIFGGHSSLHIPWDSLS